MAWAPKQLSDIPFILVGPILRKVTPTSVNVFIATKEDCQAKLKIYKNNGSTTPATLLATGTDVSMLQLGTNMFVSVLSISVSNPMESGITYGYNIEFTIGGGSYTLWNIENYDGNHGFLQIAISTLPFDISGTKYLPTFVLPPIDSSKLRVLHGSCRKSHGEGLDAMENAWTILFSTATNPDTVTDPTERRPQMMFLTGDQIYSDDVSDIMLYMIDRYAQLLLGWDENLAPLGCDVNNLAPGKRSPNIVNVAKFSVEAEVAGSHLMKLREFILMYCMTWSNALWKENQTEPGIPVLPSFEDLYPGENKTEQTTVLHFGTVSTIPRKTEKYTIYSKQLDYINKLFQSVNKNFRGILANIPLYMILDDHEITDDLFYNGQWYQDAIEGSPLGKRICTSGMAAYALFQDWGNKPEDYITGTMGKELLNKIIALRAAPNNSTIWNAISDIVLPQLDTSSNPAKFVHSAGSLNWNYYYEVSNVYEFIVLDTRTMRVFNHGLDGVPGLMSDEAQTLQIESPGENKSKHLIFIISPTPVVGVRYIEANKEDAITNRIKRLFVDKYVLDLEHWSFDKKAYERFYAMIFKRNANASFLQVVLLGGDVHYAYSSRMQYWAQKTFIGENGPKQLSVAGLCASSFKNEVSASNVSFGEWLVAGYTKAYHDDNLNENTDTSVIYGWQNSSESTFDIEIDIDLSPLPNAKRRISSKGVKPFVIDRNQEFNSAFIPQILNNPYHDWQYRIFPMKRINPGFVPNPGNGSSLSSFKKYVQAHKELYEKSGDGGRYIVGYNNMGDIVLESGTQGIGYVYHRIWWANDADRQYYKTAPDFPDVGSPYTIHKIAMGLYGEPLFKDL